MKASSGGAVSVEHNLNGYDKRTESIVYSHPVPPSKIQVAKECAKVSHMDADAPGLYLLVPSTARRLAMAIGVHNLDTHRYDWFLQPSSTFEDTEKSVS